MSSVIILTQQNVVNDGLNSNFQYTLPFGWTCKNMEMALSSVNMYYACNNISPIYGNQTFTYSWTVGSTLTTYTVTIPQGMYNITDIASYLQSVFIANGHYLINSTGQGVYYIDIITNSVTYSVNIVTYPVPTSLPSGYTQPTNFAGYPTIICNPIVTLTSNIATVFGYTVGFATIGNNGNNTTLFYTSSTYPTITANPNFFISSNMITNKLQSPSTILHNLVPNVGFGILIKEQVAIPNFLPIGDGLYQNIQISILGANRAPVQLLDPNIAIVLLIRQKPSISN